MSKLELTPDIAQWILDNTDLAHTQVDDPVQCHDGFAVNGLEGHDHTYKCLKCALQDVSLGQARSILDLSLSIELRAPPTETQLELQRRMIHLDQERARLAEEIRRSR